MNNTLYIKAYLFALFCISSKIIQYKRTLMKTRWKPLLILLSSVAYFHPFYNCQAPLAYLFHCNVLTTEPKESFWTSSPTWTMVVLVWVCVMASWWWFLCELLVDTKGKAISNQIKSPLRHCSERRIVYYSL
jgi:glucan phosphoethanolaminetransferase (alkaline phosphatase superfamily)